MGLIVQKFGGTSVADAQKIQRAARRAIRAKLDGHHVVMVVSAMGKTTDHLVELARQITDRPNRREMDMLLSTGEQVSIALMAMAIQAAGHDALSMTGGQVGMVTDSAHTRARIKRIDVERIHKHLQDGSIVIVAGFQGVDDEFNITTLGRGGSDTTAVALAAVLNADICEIYTDVDGIYTTDPRIVPEARKLDRISYDEMLELASLGAAVMHNRAVEFGKKYHVPIHVRSSLTDVPGTMIIEEEPGMEQVVVRGATMRKDLVRVTMREVPDQPGVAADIFARVAEHNIVVDDIIQNALGNGVANISFTCDADDAHEARLLAERITEQLGGKGIGVDQGLAKVSVVGVGMRSHTGVASRMFSTLARHKVNIQNISTSEIVISCIIDQQDGKRALRALHAAFELDKSDDES